MTSQVSRGEQVLTVLINALCHKEKLNNYFVKFFLSPGLFSVSFREVGKSYYISDFISFHTHFIVVIINGASTQVRRDYRGNYIHFQHCVQIY